MICRSCGNQIDDTAKFCPYCAAKQESVEERNWRIEREPSQSSRIKPLWSEWSVATLVWLILGIILYIAGGIQFITTHSAMIGVISLGAAVMFGLLVYSKQSICLLQHYKWQLSLLWMVIPIVTFFMIRSVCLGEFEIDNTNRAENKIKFILFDLIPLLAGIVIIVLVFLDWLDVNLVVFGEGLSLMKLAKLAEENELFIRHIFWDIAEDDSVAYFRYACMFFYVSAYVILLTQLLHCILRGISFIKDSAWRAATIVGDLAAWITFCITDAYLLLLLIINIYLMMEFEDYPFNSVLQFTPAPFIVVILAAVQLVFIAKASKLHKSVHRRNV